jgi:hypothetical protein
MKLWLQRIVLRHRQYHVVNASPLRPDSFPSGIFYVRDGTGAGFCTSESVLTDSHFTGVPCYPSSRSGAKYSPETAVPRDALSPHTYKQSISICIAVARVRLCATVHRKNSKLYFNKALH